MSETLPAIFFGHGNPMNAVLTSSYTEGWRRIGADIPKPNAISAISAHWFVSETAVTINAEPRTIHDFGGYPRKL
jgi:4,5-DOPA dioxygenase extradiol